MENNLEFTCSKCKQTHDGTGIYCEDCDYDMADEEVIDMFDDK